LRIRPEAAIIVGMNDVTRLLNSLAAGDRHAASDLLPLVYDELRRLAAHKLSNEQPGQTLQPTALVHEAYLRLVGSDGGQQPHWDGRGHFFAAAAEAMRRILIENARRKKAARRGGGRERVSLEDFHRVSDPHTDLLAIDEALTRLAAEEPDKAELVKLRFFGGLSTPEAAAVLGISDATAERWWAYARVWLFRELKTGDDETSLP
jgi:RNA polymerase sigma factor (TIGR02999 family)